MLSFGLANSLDHFGSQKGELFPTPSREFAPKSFPMQNKGRALRPHAGAHHPPPDLHPFSFGAPKRSTSQGWANLKRAPQSRIEQAPPPQFQTIPHLFLGFLGQDATRACPADFVSLCLSRCISAHFWLMPLIKKNDELWAFGRRTALDLCVAQA